MPAIAATQVCVVLAASEARVSALAGGVGAVGVPGREERMVCLENAAHARDLLGALHRILLATHTPERASQLPDLTASLVGSVADEVTAKYSVLSAQVDKPVHGGTAEGAVLAIRELQSAAPAKPVEPPVEPKAAAPSAAVAKPGDVTPPKTTTPVPAAKTPAKATLGSKLSKAFGGKKKKR